MKIGDRVKSEKWEVEGIIKNIQPCPDPRHRDDRVVLDIDGEVYPEYYDVGDFKIVERVCK